MAVAHAPKSYFQQTSSSGGSYGVAHPNPAYFQQGYLHQGSMLHGRGGHKGATKHGRAGVHGRHGSPMVSFRDPWMHKGVAKHQR